MIGGMISSLPQIFHLLALIILSVISFLFCRNYYKLKDIRKRLKDAREKQNAVQAMLDAQTQKPRDKEQLTERLDKGNF